jgi:hypothetical protein
MAWNYRFFNQVLIECYYDDQGRPEAYCNSRFDHLFSTEEYDKMVQEWTKEWQDDKNGSTIEPQEISVLHDDGSVTTEIYPPEAIIIPPEPVGTLDDFIKEKMNQDWQELTEAMIEASWYEKQGFPPLVEEFAKPIDQRTYNPPYPKTKNEI